MEIGQSQIEWIDRTNTENTAVYRVVNGALLTLYRSPGIPALCGMDAEEYRAVTERDAAVMVLEADRPAAADKLAEVLRGGDAAKRYSLTCRIRHKSRGFLWVRAKIRLLGERGGDPVLVCSFATAEGNAAEFAALLNGTDRSIYVIDQKTYELFYVNDPALRSCGDRGYAGARCYRYFNGLDAPCPWCTLPQMKNGFLHVDEAYVPPFDRWYSHDVRALNWYGRDAVAFFLTNITEQKRRQQQEAERFANFYRQVAQANPNTLAMFRLNLTRNTCTDGQSPYQAALAQQRSGTADGYLAACAEIITDEAIRRDCLTRFTLPNLLAEYQNGVRSLSLEYPIRSAAGETIWIDGFITMMQNPVTGDLEAIAHAVNVTNRKINENIVARISEEKYDHIGLIRLSDRTYELRKNDLASRGPELHRRVDYAAALDDILAHGVCPEDRELFADHGNLDRLLSRLEQSGSDTFVYRCRVEDGGLLHKQVTYSWLNEDRNLILEVQADVTSVHEQQLEQLKRRHEDELLKERALSAESIPSGIGVFDVTGDTVCLYYFNDGFYQMIGRSREDCRPFEGVHALDAALPEDRPAIREELAAALREKRQFRCRFRLCPGLGSCRWVDVRANHIPVQETTERFFAAFYDVDELLRTQTELQEKELIFRDLLRYSDLTHFTYYPARHRYETAILPARLAGLPKIMDDYPDSFIRYIGLNDADAEAYRAMVRAIDRGAPEAECTVLMHLGEKNSWCRVHLLSICNEAGLPVKAIGNTFNVDKAKAAEKALADERMRMDSLRGEYLATASFNVTQDTESEFTRGGGLSRAESIEPWIYAWALKIEPGIARQRTETLRTLLSAAAQIPDEAQRTEFVRCSSHDGMLRLYREGKRDVTVEYGRQVDEELVWMSTRIILLSEPDTGDVLAFFYTRDINEQKKSEQIVNLTLKKSCDYIALINTKKNTLSFQSISDSEMPYIAGLAPDRGAEYVPCASLSINGIVSDADRKTLARKTTIANLTSRLNAAAEYSVTYDRYAHDGTTQRKQLRYRWLNERRDEILAVQTDITAAYEKEQENLRRMREALETAEKANQAKTEFVSRISHDIRTPISIITNMAEFARADKNDPDKLESDLAKIETSNKFLLSLINDVLDISKIDSGKIELNPAPYRYAEYRDMIRSVLEPQCQQKGLRCEIVSLGSDSHVICIDKVRLNQITFNLISNAVKYTSPGGTITFTSDSRALPDGRIEGSFRVRDTGIGMSEEFQKTMFEPFTQEYSNPYRSKTEVGTGLGLSIVRRLLDLLGGSITVRSELGVGTDISVRFTGPAEAADRARLSDQEPAGEQPLRRLSGRVLLAEDNPINAEIAVRILNTLGLSTDWAENGELAVRRFASSDPGAYAAIFMDIQMPVLNGYEATERIRADAHPDARSIPIIAMTADAYTEAMERCKKAGMTDYVTKPFDARQLYNILSGYMT